MSIKYQRGFSLVEVMISMVILAFGIIGTIGMFGASSRAIDISNRMTLALRLAQEKLEYKKGAGFEQLLLDDIDGDGAMETKMRDDSTSGDEVAGDGIYTGSDTNSGISRKWMVSLNNPVAGVARIEVIASWTDQNGINHYINLSTIKSDGVYR